MEYAAGVRYRNPDKDLPAATGGNQRPTVANTFIAVYDDRLSAGVALAGQRRRDRPTNIRRAM